MIWYYCYCDNLRGFNCARMLGGLCGTQSSRSLTSVCFRYRLNMKFTQWTGKEVAGRPWLAAETKDLKCVQTITSLQARGCQKGLVSGRKPRPQGSDEWKSGSHSIFCCVQCSWWTWESHCVLIKKEVLQKMNSFPYFRHVLLLAKQQSKEKFWQ